MKTFLVFSGHNIYEDDYVKGEGRYVNCFDLEAEIKSDNAKEAIKIFCDNTLYFPIELKDIEANEENEKLFSCSWLVDDDNMLASPSKIEKWRKGKITLYADNVEFSVFELVAVNI